MTTIPTLHYPQIKSENVPITQNPVPSRPTPEKKATPAPAHNPKCRCKKRDPRNVRFY